MTDSPQPTPDSVALTGTEPTAVTPPAASAPDAPSPDPPSPEPKPSYTKLAMRNMVKKKGKSLTHFFLSTVGMVALLVGLAYLTR
ncbi:MAG: DUF3285 domain-containing protein [Spirulinaceae cyanobacterium]